MLISTFNTQLQKKHPQATAYVPDGFGTGKRKANQVNVVYSPNGKVYEYKGTILSVAERLGLIPEINYEMEAQRIASELKHNTREVIGHDGCQDTVRYLFEKWVETKDAGVDEFDRPLVIFYISTESKW